MEESDQRKRNYEAAKDDAGSSRPKSDIAAIVELKVLSDEEAQVPYSTTSVYETGVDVARRLVSSPEILLANGNFENWTKSVFADERKTILADIRDLLSATCRMEERDSAVSLEGLKGILKRVPEMNSRSDLPQFLLDDDMITVVPDSHWRKFAILKINDMVKDRENLLLRSENLVKDLLLRSERLLASYKSVGVTLHHLASLSQAENVLNTIAADEAKMRSKTIRDQAVQQERGEKLIRTDMRTAPCKIAGSAKHLSVSEYFAVDSFRDLDVPRKLRLLAKLYNYALEKCQFLERPEAETVKKGRNRRFQPINNATKAYFPKNIDSYCNLIRITINTLQEGYEKYVDAPETDHDENELGNIFTDVQNLKFPGCRAQEVNGTQPIFEWLISKIAMIAEENNPSIPSGVRTYHRKDGTSPVKSKIGKESGVVTDNITNCVRYGDFTVVKQGRHLWVYTGDYLPFVIEIKPFERTDKDWKEVAENALQQVLAHCSKYLEVLWNFGGIGVDGHATAASSTLAYVRLHRLNLEGMGSCEAEVQLRNTDYLPLMQERPFSMFVQSNDRGRPTGSFEDLGFSPEGEVPQGFIALYHAITTPSTNLFSAPTQEKVEYTTLGYGSFGTVYSGGPDQVNKVSRFGRFAYLKNEADCLKQLNQLNSNENSCNNLPILIEDLSHDIVSVREYQVPLQRITLSPRCSYGAVNYIYKNKEHQAQATKMIFGDCQAGLEYMHNNGFVHKDVSPKNIMVRQQSNEPDRAILIDFSIASKVREKCPGREGNLQTMHIACMKHDFWYPDGRHDMVSLAYTMAIMCNNGTTPWTQLCAASTKPAQISDRQKEAKRTYKRNLFEQEHIDTLSKLVDMDTMAYYKCQCSQECKRCKCSAIEIQCSPHCSKYKIIAKVHN